MSRDDTKEAKQIDCGGNDCLKCDVGGRCRIGDDCAWDLWTIMAAYLIKKIKVPIEVNAPIIVETCSKMGMKPGTDCVGLLRSRCGIGDSA